MPSRRVGSLWSASSACTGVCDCRFAAYRLLLVPFRHVLNSTYPARSKSYLSCSAAKRNLSSSGLESPATAHPQSSITLSAEPGNYVSNDRTKNVHLNPSSADSSRDRYGGRLFLPSNQATAHPKKLSFSGALSC